MLDEIRHEAARDLDNADVAIITSYCADGAMAAQLVLDSDADVKVFYDLDTPVTLNALHLGALPGYLPPDGLGNFDLVLSYTGGRALSELMSNLGARRVAPLYGWVDPDLHGPAQSLDEFRCELSYLGTFAEDRQPALEEFFLKPARERMDRRFVIGGAQYPETFPWNSNIYFVRHLPPAQHPAFFCSGRATLNITRRAMAMYGYCPSGRLFEAAACGIPIVTDMWEGLNTFFEYGQEVLPVAEAQDVLFALELSDAELHRTGEAARAKTLEKHTAMARAMELERLLECVKDDRVVPAFG
jgi:spore maturation protein CgeB